MSRFGHDAGGRHTGGDPRLQEEEEEGYESPRLSRAKPRERLLERENDAAEKQRRKFSLKYCFPKREMSRRRGRVGGFLPEIFGRPQGRFLDRKRFEASKK